MVAQNRMKKQADKQRRELNFEVGDEVFLSSMAHTTWLKRLKLWHTS